jgi:hypothetical protein
MPITGFATNFSPILRIAPPPSDREIDSTPGGFVTLRPFGTSLLLFGPAWIHYLSPPVCRAANEATCNPPPPIRGVKQWLSFRLYAMSDSFTTKFIVQLLHDTLPLCRSFSFSSCTIVCFLAVILSLDSSTAPYFSKNAIKNGFYSLLSHLTRINFKTTFSKVG